MREQTKGSVLKAVRVLVSAAERSGGPVPISHASLIDIANALSQAEAIAVENDCQYDGCDVDARMFALLRIALGIPLRAEEDE